MPGSGLCQCKCTNWILPIVCTCAVSLYNPSLSLQLFLVFECYAFNNEVRVECLMTWLLSLVSNFRSIFQLYPQDLMCIHTLLAFEYVSQLCQNKDWSFPACDPRPVAGAVEGDGRIRYFVGIFF